MKKCITGVMSLALMLMIVVFPCVQPTHAVTTEGAHNGASENLQSAFVVAADQLSTSDEAVCSAVKRVVDFAGNEYTVVEYSPVGYFIFHNDSGNYVEYAENARSPYYGYEENIYYGGPTEYYIKEGDTYYHTMLEDIQIDASYENEMAASSAQLDQNLSEKPAEISVNAMQSSASSTTNVYITNGENFFVNNTSFGYVSGGYCGYIAASMVLQFYDYCGNINLGSVAPSGVTYRLINVD